MFRSNQSYFCKNCPTSMAKQISSDLENAITHGNHAEATKLFDKVKKYMQQRIEENYFDPIDDFIKRINQIENTHRGQGNAPAIIPENTAFIVMGINCILVELYFEMTHGFDESKATVVIDGKSKKFNTSDAYKEVLKALDNSITPKVAQIFYKGIRCGVIHQGQTKKIPY